MGRGREHAGCQTVRGGREPQAGDARGGQAVGAEGGRRWVLTTSPTLVFNPIVCIDEEF